MILQVILACVLCFAITAVAGKLLIPELIKLKAGQSIKEVGPTWHMTKQGTPTMGGRLCWSRPCPSGAPSPWWLWAGRA